MGRKRDVLRPLIELGCGIMAVMLVMIVLVPFLVVLVILGLLLRCRLWRLKRTRPEVYARLRRRQVYRARHARYTQPIACAGSDGSYPHLE
jgi:hypothetical protein